MDRDPSYPPVVAKAKMVKSCKKRDDISLGYEIYI